MSATIKPGGRSPGQWGSVSNKNLILLAALVAAPVLAGITNIIVQTNARTIIDNTNAGAQSVDGPASDGIYQASADFGVLKAYASAAAPVPSMAAAAIATPASAPPPASPMW